MNKKVLIIGPLPPAIGGIATIVGTLKNEFAGEAGFFFIDTSKPSGFFRRLIRPIELLIKIGFAGLKIRGGTVLMFSSAYGSFWEKCIWCLVCRLMGLRTVLQMVDGNFPRFHEGLPKPLRWLALMFIKTVDVLAVQSYQWKIVYEKIFPHTTVKIVSPGIDTDFFSPLLNRIMNNPVEVIYIGWLIEEKGVYDLLNATQLAIRSGCLFKLKLIGPDFGNKQRIYEHAKTLDLENIIDISGPITSREMIRNAYQSSDIFVFPSHFEGFPYALMEAISSGLPCIGTRVGGVPDILDNGLCGLLIEKKSPVQLAESLCALIGNKEYRLMLGKRARERAVSEYTLVKSFNDFKSVLHITDKGQ